MTTINNGFDHGGNHPQLNLPPISQELLAGNAQGRSRPSAEVTDYESRKLVSISGSCLRIGKASLCAPTKTRL
jgi:hypothetical protein